MNNDTSSHLPQNTPDGTPILYVCHGQKCGRSAKFIMDRVQQIKEKGVSVQAERCLCMDMCAKAPNVKYKGKIYSQMSPISVAALVKGK